MDPSLRIPTLSKARQLLRRADAVAGNILMQLAKTQAMPIPGGKKPETRWNKLQESCILC